MYASDLRERFRARLDPAPDPVLPRDTRFAAVLVPVIEGPEPSLVFTRRTEYLPRHPGEISFPGGLWHDEDPGLWETALRETEEELGIEPELVDVVGALAPVHTFVSGILIVPFVGMLLERPVFAPDPGEIAEVLEFGLARLAGAEAEVEWPLDDHVYRGFAYELDGSTIWGATARILHELIEIVRKEAP